VRSISEPGTLQRDVGAPTPVLSHTSKPQAMPRQEDVPEGSLSSLLCIPAMIDLVSFLMFGNMKLPATTLIQLNQRCGTVHARGAAQVNTKVDKYKTTMQVPYISLSFNSVHTRV